MRLCREFAAAFPAQIKCTSFGETPEGRKMMALIVSGDGTFTPGANRKKKRPVVLIQGGIHAGEIDGKDAGFLALKELLKRNAAASPFRKVTFVFVPVFNIDGHERFGTNNRPNQIGPEEMGWRTTGQNLNLNRDYVKADAPEMQAMLRLLTAWDPILYADLHVTDGAHYQPVIALIFHPALKGPEPIRKVGEKVSDEMMKRLSPHLALPFYPSFVKEEEPASGFELGISPPRFSQAYWGNRGRIGVLVETHSWKDYATRVKATYDTILGLLDLAASQGGEWLKAAAETDALERKLAGTEVPLTYDVTPKSKPFEFKGVAYRREKSPVSGDLITIYDPKTPEVWTVPLFDELVPKLAVTAPKRGYYVPPAHTAAVARKLELHGISFQTLTKQKEGEFQTFRATETTFSKAPFEGRTRLELKGSWAPEKETIAAGSLFVPIDQKGARLILHLLEPQAPDSLAAWGYFNAAFEQKEYMEAYVAHQVGTEMLEKDPKVKEAFQKRLKEDEEFAKSPEKRLDFFYRRHPAYDVRYNRYPIFKE